MERREFNLYCVSGKICSGKDTQAEKLRSLIPGSIITSTGEIVRGAKAPKGKFHEELAPYLEGSKKGQLIPDDVMLPIVEKTIIEQYLRGEKDSIFTGFPRTVNQLFMLDAQIASMKDSHPDTDINVYHICYAVLDKHAIERSEFRRNDKIQKGEPIREDDKPETVLARLGEYRKDGLTSEMLHILADSHTVYIIKSGGPKENVYKRTEEFVKKLNWENKKLFVPVFEPALGL